MSDPQPVTFTEDRIPFEGIEDAIEDQVELYGGEVTERHDRERRFILPLRRGISAGGGVECTVSWAPDDEREATVTLTCNRDIDRPKPERLRGACSDADERRRRLCAARYRRAIHTTPGRKCQRCLLADPIAGRDPYRGDPADGPPRWFVSRR